MSHNYVHLLTAWDYTKPAPKTYKPDELANEILSLDLTLNQRLHKQPLRVQKVAHVTLFISCSDCLNLACFKLVRFNPRRYYII